jgi:long-chain acyl-CoA synthetase
LEYHPPDSLPDFLEDICSRYRDKTALYMRRGHRIVNMTYNDLLEFSLRTAAYLLNKKMAKGDRVIIIAPNMPEWAGVFFGCMNAGLVVVPLDTSSSPDFRRMAVQKTRPAYLFCSRINISGVRELDVPFDCIEELLNKIAAAPVQALVKPGRNDLAEIVFTSGTTGEPKGVMLTHGNLVSDVSAVSQVVPLKAGAKTISLLPLSHVLEQTAGLFAFLKFGGTVIYPANHRPATILKLMHDQKVTNMIVFAQVFQLFRDRLHRAAEKGHKLILLHVMMRIASVMPTSIKRLMFRSLHRQVGGRLQFVICGGSYLDPQLIWKYECMGIPVLLGYGLTEASPIVSVNSLKDRRLDSAGKALPGVEIKIAPDGELLLQGPNITPGFWEDPQATTAAFEEGYYRSGDLGEIDGEGHLYLKGIKKDMISTNGGLNVNAQDIEKAFASSPDVRDICVVGVPTPEGKKKPHAVLILNCPPEFASEVVQNVNLGLPEYQRVEDFTVWPLNNFPVTHTLKIKKNVVVDYLTGKIKLGGLETSRKKADENSPGLYRIIASLNRMSPADFRPQMSLGKDLQLDSLGRVELLSAIESELDISLDEAQVAASTTLSDLQVLLSKKSAAARNAEYPRWPLKKGAVISRHLLHSLGMVPAVKLFTRLSVRGKENLAGIKGPFLLAANHQSHIDTLALFAALPSSIRRKTTSAAGADYWFGQGLFREFIAQFVFNAFAFSRTDAILSSLNHCANLVEQGWNIVLYPEGTRAQNGEIAPFKSGIGFMALEFGIPVIPVYISGTFDMMPKGKTLPKPGKAAICIGKPVSLARGISYSEATGSVRDAIVALQKECR